MPKNEANLKMTNNEMDARDLRKSSKYNISNDESGLNNYSSSGQDHDSETDIKSDMYDTERDMSDIEDYTDNVLGGHAAELGKCSQDFYFALNVVQRRYNVSFLNFNVLDNVLLSGQLQEVQDYILASITHVESLYKAYDVLLIDYRDSGNLADESKLKSLSQVLCDLYSKIIEIQYESDKIFDKGDTKNCLSKLDTTFGRYLITESIRKNIMNIIGDVVCKSYENQDMNYLRAIYTNDSGKLSEAKYLSDKMKKRIKLMQGIDPDQHNITTNGGCFYILNLLFDALLMQIGAEVQKVQKMMFEIKTQNEMQSLHERVQMLNDDDRARSESVASFSDDEEEFFDAECEFDNVEELPSNIKGVASDNVVFSSTKDVAFDDTGEFSDDDIFYDTGEFSDDDDIFYDTGEFSDDDDIFYDTVETPEELLKEDTELTSGRGTALPRSASLLGKYAKTTLKEDTVTSGKDVANSNVELLCEQIPTLQLSTLLGHDVAKVIFHKNTKASSKEDIEVTSKENVTNLPNIQPENSNAEIWKSRFLKMLGNIKSYLCTAFNVLHIKARNVANKVMSNDLDTSVLARSCFDDVTVAKDTLEQTRSANIDDNNYADMLNFSTQDTNQNPLIHNESHREQGGDSGRDLASQRRSDDEEIKSDVSYTQKLSNKRLKVHKHNLGQSHFLH